MNTACRVFGIFVVMAMFVVAMWSLTGGAVGR